MRLCLSCVSRKTFKTQIKSLAIAGILAGSFAIAGCGGGASHQRRAAKATAHQAPTLCSVATRALLARAAGVAPGAVQTGTGTSNEGAPQCMFRAPGLKVTAIIDSGPQPYFRLERTVVEEAQQFSQVRLEPQSRKARVAWSRLQATSEKSIGALFCSCCSK